MLTLAHLLSEYGPVVNVIFAVVAAVVVLRNTQHHENPPKPRRIELEMIADPEKRTRFVIVGLKPDPGEWFCLTP